ncbi:hypothetical protein ASD55_11795 [Rhodanobacter sp. Root561]|uniref:hypothetical protein n=1 Tax=Rhodanobacter sp. Root561 TaxID=1736560 RepID=UPI0006F5F292|nr:hypothetical protein [Rhodanobacter sp. Root561]KQZ70961.1 hypothetical protein ASD55_11795 [Rhodanobacter sp. Root561]
MYKDERDIFYYDAVPHVWHKKYKKGLPPFSHYELARALAHLFKNDRAEVTKQSTRQAIYITEIDLYSDRCEMLIGFADPNAADPTFNDRPAKKRRVVPKVGDEGLEHSSHIVWYYQDQTRDKPCPFYLEGATGLSSTAIVRFVNKLIREFCKLYPKHFTVLDPSGAHHADGTPKRIGLRPSLELRGHPSAEFIRDLNGGEIAELELITESKAADVWDANGYAVEDYRGVLLKPSTLKHVPKAKKFIDGVLSTTVKHNYEKSRVVFKTDGNVRKNVTFYSKNYQLVNDLKYVKKSRIKGLGGRLPNAFDTIYGPIMAEVRKIATGGAKPLSKKKLVV